MLMGDGTSSPPSFVPVKVGLYRPTTKGTRAVLLVMKNSKEAFQLAAPFRVGLRLTTPSGVTDFRVFRDVVPEARVPGICLIFSASSPIVASQWIGALTPLAPTATPSAAGDSAAGGVGGGGGIAADSAGPGTSTSASGAAPTPATADQKQRLSGQPDGVINVVHGATWQRFAPIDLQRTQTVAAVMDAIVNRSLKDVPTSYNLCFSQPVPGTMLAAHWVVTDSGPSSLDSFAGETLFVIPRQDTAKVDTFAQWIDQLSRPSALAAFRRWNGSKEEQQQELLRSVEETTLPLRDDFIKRMYGPAYCDPRLAPAVAFDRYRLHDLDDALAVSRVRTRTELLQVVNQFDRAVLLYAHCPPADIGVQVVATPEIVKVLPKERKTIRFDFSVVAPASVALDPKPYFIHVFSSTVVPSKDKRSSVGHTRLEGYPAVFPVSFTCTSAAAVALQPAFRVRVVAEADLPHAEDQGPIQFCGIRNVHCALVGESQLAVATVMRTPTFDADLEKLQHVGHSTLLLPSIVVPAAEQGKARLLIPLPDGAATVLAAVNNPSKPLGSMFAQLKVALDVATALRVAHSRGLVHGCIRPEHVLVSSFKFEYSSFDGTTPDNAMLLGSWLGLLDPAGPGMTPYCCAPETTSESGPRPATLESDVFAFGTLLYTLLSGWLPFSDLREYENSAAIESKMRAGARPSLNTPALQSVPGDVHRLLNDCWAIAPEKRPTMLDVVRRLCNAIAGHAEPVLPLPSSIPRVMQLLETGRPREGSLCGEPPTAVLAASSAPGLGPESPERHTPRPVPPSTAPPPLPEHPAPPVRHKHGVDEAPPPMPPTAAAPPVPKAAQLQQNTFVVTVSAAAGGNVVKLRLSRGVSTTVDHVRKLACKLLRCQEGAFAVADAGTLAILSDASLTAMAAAANHDPLSLVLCDVKETVPVVVVVAPARLTIGSFSRAATAAGILSAVAFRAKSLGESVPVPADHLAMVDGVSKLRMADRATPLLGTTQPTAEATLTAVARESLQNVRIVEAGTEVATLTICSSATFGLIAGLAASRRGYEVAHVFLFAPGDREPLVPELTVAELLSDLSSKPDTFEVSLEHYLPVPLSFESSGTFVEVVMTQGLAVPSVIKKAAQATNAVAPGADAAAALLLCQCTTGAVIEEARLDTAVHGTKLFLIPKEAAATYEVRSSSGGDPPFVRIRFSASTIVRLADLTRAMAPGERGKYVLIDGATGIELTADKIIPPTMNIVAYQVASPEVLRFTVRHEKGQQAWASRALGKTSAATIRTEAVKVLGTDGSILQDRESCIIDDLCTLMELESTDLILCD